MNELERLQAIKRRANKNYLQLKHLKDLAIRCKEPGVTDLDRSALRLASYLVNTRNYD